VSEHWLIYRDERGKFLLELSALRSLAKVLLPRPPHGVPGRPESDPLRNLTIYCEVNYARTKVGPKRLKNRKRVEDIEPVQLSWEKARELAKWWLEKDWNINLSTGAIRAAYRHGKQVADTVQRKRQEILRGVPKKAC
jgi:hypothetical protein